MPPPAVEVPLTFKKMGGARALTDAQVVWLRRYGWRYTMPLLSQMLEAKEKVIEKALKGLSYKHLNHIAKPQR